MGKKLTNNWGLKLIAILFALILWFAVINIDDPVVSETFKNVPVQLVNTEVLTDAGMTYEVLDNSTVVENITVYGPRTLVESLNENDIIAKADINDITVANTVAITVTVDTRNSSKITNIRTSLDCVKLNIEEARSKQLVINAATTGKLASGYVVKEMELDQNRIRISGPASVVSTIAAAKVSVDVTDANSDVATYGTVRLYDKNGNEVESELLLKSTEKVHVSVDVVPTKYVPVKFQVTGTPEDGYAVVYDNIVCDVATVLLGGETEQLRYVDEIVISGEELNVDKAKETVEYTVLLKNYLPDDIILADKEYDGKVTVTIPVEEVVTEVVELKKENISVTGIPENLSVSLKEVPDYMDLEVTGVVSKIREIMTGDVKAVLNMEDALTKAGLSNWETGVYEVEADLQVSESVEHTPVKLKIEITKNT